MPTSWSTRYLPWVASLSRPAAPRIQQPVQQRTQRRGREFTIRLLGRVRDVVEKHGGRVVVEHPGQIEEPAWSDSGHPRIDRRGRGEINGSQPLLKRIGCDAGPERLLVGRERLEARVQGGLPEVERAEAVASR